MTLSTIALGNMLHHKTKITLHTPSRNLQEKAQKTHIVTLTSDLGCTGHFRNLGKANDFLF